MTKFILLTGAHGVGKDYLLDQIDNQIDLNHYDASALIKLKLGQSDVHKRVKDIDYSQEVLLQAIKENISDDKAILISHLCIVNSSGIIERIKENRIKALNVLGIIMIKDDILQMVKRLHKRDNLNWNAEFIKQLQDEEEAYAKEISRTFSIPLFFFINGENTDKVINEIHIIESTDNKCE